jgi:hypothetical protein
MSFARAEQTSVLTDDGISFMGFTRVGENTTWTAAYSNMDVGFSLDSTTTVSVEGLFSHWDLDGGSYGSISPSIRLETADGSQTIFDTSDFSYWEFSGYGAEHFTVPEGFDEDLLSYVATNTNAGSGNPVGMGLMTTITLDAGAYRLLVDNSGTACGYQFEDAYDMCGDFGASFGTTAFRMATVVPVPPALLLFPSALAVLGWFRRRGLPAGP